MTMRTTSQLTPARVHWLAAVALVSGCQSSDQIEPAGRTIDWPPERTLAYDLSLVTSTELPSQSSFELVLTARLELSVLSRSADRVELAVLLRHPKLTASSGARDPALDRIERDLSKAAWFELVGGKLSRERFAADLAPEAVATERSLLAALQLPGHAGSETQWTATEFDGTGRYRARYAVEPAGSSATTVTKQRLGYEDLLATGKLSSLDRSGMAPRVIHSELALHLDRGELRSVHGKEQLEVAMLGSKLVTRSSLDLELTGAIEAPGIASMRSELLASTREIAPESGYGATAERGRFDRVRANGESFEELVQALARETASSADTRAVGQLNGVPVPGPEAARSKERLGKRLDVFSSLVALLRQAPENVAKTRQLIDSGSPLSRELVDVLGSTGTPLAQEVLAAIALDSTRARVLRAAAATSLIRLEQPSPASIATLHAMTRDPMLTDFGVFGLGSASRRLRERGDVADADRIASELVQHLQAATDDRVRIRTLRGIANSAYPGAVEAVAPLLKARPRSVRSAAVEAVRLIRTPAADALVAEAAADAESSIVRNTAVQVAGMRAPSDVLLEAMKRLALNEPDDSTRQHAVEVIARWLPRRSDIRSLLEQVSVSDRKKPIKDVALAALNKS
jgi:hypothetical protein